MIQTHSKLGRQKWLKYLKSRGGKKMDGNFLKGIKMGDTFHLLLLATKVVVGDFIKC